MANITGDSPQAVALELLERIAAAENWSSYTGTYPPPMGLPWQKTKDEILDTYAECLKASTVGARAVSSGSTRRR